EAGIQLRVASPLPSPTSPPTNHPLPLPVGGSAAATAKQPGLGAARTTDYGFVYMVDNAPRRYVPKKDNRARLSGRVDILLEDKQFHQQTVMLMEDKALISHSDTGSSHQFTGDIDSDLGCSGFITIDPDDSSSRSDSGTIASTA
ncbi:hypothetical protein Tco_0398431, partial [Tanacetum coccineum]